MWNVDKQVLRLNVEFPLPQIWNIFTSAKILLILKENISIKASIRKGIMLYLLQRELIKARYFHLLTCYEAAHTANLRYEINIWKPLLN